MALLKNVVIIALLALRAHAAESTTTDGDGVVVLTGTKSTSEAATPTGTYKSYASTASSSSLSSMADNATVTSSSTTETVTFLTGSKTSSSTLSGNFSITSSSTSTEPAPTNTQPCNGWPEFCSRKYSNVTLVGCHNSPFIRAGSTAANQDLDVTTQLNDGVRFLQGQIQWPTNGTEPHFCHTSCDILDAGPITEWLGKVQNWVAAHPYDVVTILLGNGNYSDASMYAPFIESTGIQKYAFVPDSAAPWTREQWPTYSELILKGVRTIMFIDYNYNATAAPYLLDEFGYFWESPFDPEDNSFPCTVQRPPRLMGDENVEAARNSMYIMNHNLNVEVSLLGASLLVPAITVLNTTNNVSGVGSAGLAANNCRSDWGTPPSVILVDYYEYGGFAGSIFEVAAAQNNVTYDRSKCCGKVSSGAQRSLVALSSWGFGVIAVGFYLVL